MSKYQRGRYEKELYITKILRDLTITQMHCENIEDLYKASLKDLKKIHEDLRHALKIHFGNPDSDIYPIRFCLKTKGKRIVLDSFPIPFVSGYTPPEIDPSDLLISEDEFLEIDKERKISDNLADFRTQKRVSKILEEMGIREI
jgi:hypothetical protein